MNTNKIMSQQEFSENLRSVINQITVESFRPIEEHLKATNNGRSAAINFGQARLDAYHRLPELLNSSRNFAGEAVSRLIVNVVQHTGNNMDFKDVAINYDPETFEITLSGSISGDWGTASVTAIPVEWFSPKWSKMTPYERSVKWPIHSGAVMNVSKAEYDRRTLQNK